MAQTLPQHAYHGTCVSGVKGAVSRAMASPAPTRRPYPSQTSSSTAYSVRGTTATLRPLQAQPQSPPRHLVQRPAAAAATTTLSSASVQTPQKQQQQQGALRGLYPPTTAHDSGYLRVSEFHSIYYEVHGKPAGIPAVVIHGGPGAGCYPNHARFFDPQHYRIILLDQRGCGRSTPTGCLHDNTTAALVSDLNTLRKHLNIEQWILLGGSWGVALSIAYAQAYPETVLGLVLRGVCLMRPSEIQWMYGGGAAALKPLAWRRFIGELKPEERGNPVLGYYKRMLSLDASVRQAAAKSWMAWEMAVGFSSNQDLLVWDSHQWTAQQAPAAAAAAGGGGHRHVAQVLPPPPVPRTTAAQQASAAAAAAAGSDCSPVLDRGVILPAGVLAGAGSSSTSSSSSGKLDGSVRRRNTNNKNCLTQLGYVAGPVTSKHSTDRIDSDNTTLDSSSNSSGSCFSSDKHEQPAQGSSGPSAAAAAAVGSDPQQQRKPAWAWGLPGQGYNIQDPEVQTLISQGLNHKGFNNSAAQALLECHYSLHGAFLLNQPLLDDIDRIRHIPCIAVQGQMDYVCPPVTAVELSEAWPEMELRLVPSAGHSMYDPAITHELVCATDRMRGLQPQQQQGGGSMKAAAAAGRRVATHSRVRQ